MKKLLTLVTTLLVTVSLFAQENMTFQANVTNKNGDVLFIKNGRTIVKEIKADEKGRKIVQAGTVYKKGEKAIGLVFADVDVTYGPQPAAIMVEGYVLEARLPAVVSSEDKATMTGIKFR